MITKDIFLDFSFLIIAVISQFSAAIIFLRLALSKHHEAKILYVLSVFLICIVCPLTINNLLISRESTEYDVKLILTIISVLVLFFVMRLNRSEDNNSERLNNPQELKNLTHISIMLSILALFSSIILGYLGYSTSRQTFIENIYQNNSTTAQTVKAYINISGKTSFNNDLAQELQSIWVKIKPQNFESYLYLINEKGVIVLDTSGVNEPGTYVGNTGLTEFDSGQSKTGTLSKLIKTKKDWFGENINHKGELQFVNYIHSEKLDMTIAVQVPAEQIKAQINENTIPWMMGFVFITLVLLPLSLGLLHWAYTISQKNIIRTQSELRKSLDEKEILLKEIHHRVKNNLQVIYSLLGLQSKYTNDPNYLNMIKESQQRIKTMAIIHEKLYQSGDLGKIDFADYVHNLTRYLYESYNVNSNTLQIEIKIDKLYLDIDKAITCGLILNELFSNSLKHAFIDKKDNYIIISFYSDALNNYLIIKDNGRGLNKDFDIKKAGSLGLKIVGALVKQIKGQLEVIIENGTQFKITFIKD
jgi:two-component sensor histidine kinase